MAQSGCSASGLQQRSHVPCPPSQYHRHAVTLAMCPLPHPSPLILHVSTILPSPECHRAGITLHATFPVSFPLLGHIHSRSVFCGSQLTSHCCPLILYCLNPWPVHSSPAGLVPCFWLWAILNTAAGCIHIAWSYFSKPMTTCLDIIAVTWALVASMFRVHTAQQVLHGRVPLLIHTCISFSSAV